jgi:hypothetical protein
MTDPLLTKTAFNSNPSKSPFSLPRKEDMAKPMEYVASVRANFTEDEKRFVFRELAKDLLDPHGDSQLTILDNDGNVLGYFDPVAHRMREKAKHIMVPVNNLEALLQASEPFEDLVNRIMPSHQTNEE